MPTLLHVFSFIHIVIGSCGMMFNLLLIYLALFKTPQSIKVYSTLIVNFAITDFFACFTDLFVQQRLIPIGRALIHVSGGFCQYISSVACYVGHGFEMHCFAHTLWSLLLSFSYRYYILFHSSPKQLTLILIVLLVYIPSFIQFIVFFWTEDDPKDVYEILHKNFPQYTFENVAITGMKDIFSFSSQYVILHMTLPVTPVYITILILRTKITNRLSLGTNNLAERTKKIHKQLLMALSYQALIPGFYLFGVVAYACGQFGIYHHPVLEYVTFLALLMIPVLSPISSFVFVTPYRNYILTLVGKGPKTAPNSVQVSYTPTFSSPTTKPSRRVFF